MTNPSESETVPTTILVDVQLQRTDAREHDASLQELRQLIETLGWKIAGTLTQKMSSLNAASLIGAGKLEELSELVRTLEVDSVAFDHELTTTQVRNIREATGVDVYDRPAIILEIFHRHARTKEAQLQVELGHTNAGKSSLMRALTSSDVLVVADHTCAVVHSNRVDFAAHS